MKKFLTMLLAMCIFVLATACGGATETQENPSVEKDTEEQEESVTEGDNEHSLVFLTSTLGDMGFYDNAWDGIQALAAEYGYACEAIEMGSDVAVYEASFLDALDSGKYDVFLTDVVGGMSDYVAKYASEYPEYKFIVFDVDRSYEVASENIVAITYLQNEGAYLGGVLAASLSKTGKIGIYLHTDSPVLNDFATGYYQGAVDCNPDIKIYTAYGAGVSGDSARCSDLTGIMFDSGADVVFGCAGSSNPGLFQKVLDLGGFEAGYYAIGVNYDQWLTFSNSDKADLADAIASSVMKDAGTSLQNAWKYLEVDKSASWGTLLMFGMNDGAVGIAQNEYYQECIPQEVQDVVSGYEEKIRNGEIKIKSYFDFENNDEFIAYQSESAVSN